METVITYLIKSSSLLLVFFATYHFLLKKNTFFNSNRWFLLVGIFCSILLPFLSFQKTVWVEPEIIPFEITNLEPNTIEFATPMQPIEAPELPWEMIVGLLYGTGVLVFLTQLLIEFYSLRKIIKNNTKIQEDGFELIEVNDAISPFSFFKKIVYNRNLFQPEELQNIIEHEKIHARQMHSLDVLIARIQCIVFWWNPLVWLYKKAMVQNLEFIADQNALAKAKDKKSYLLTLLKITTAEKHVAITNHFYQSLIKKRIVMLHKNQSKKHHSWTYFSVIPVLIFFIATYQVEVVAQVKEVSKSNIETGSTRVSIMFESSFTDSEIKDKLKILSGDNGVVMQLKKTRRNKNGAITSIKIILSDKTGTQKIYDISSSEPIRPFTVYVDTDENNNVTFGFDDARAHLLMDENSKNQKFLDSLGEAISTADNVKITNMSTTFSVEITANSTDETFQQYQNYLHSEYNLYLRIDKIKRNKRKEITTIRLSLINKKDQITSYAVSGDDAIKPFTINAGYDDNKGQTFGFGADSKNPHLKNHFEATERSTNNSKSQRRLFENRKGPLEDNTELLENVLIVLDGKIISTEEFDKVDANSIKSVTVVKRDRNRSDEYEELFKEYGERAKNGIMSIVTEAIKKPAEKDNSGWGMDYKTSSPKDNIVGIIENKTVDYKKALITLNGKEITAAEMEKINPKSIETVTVSGGINNAEFNAMYGEKTKFGVIQIEKHGYEKPVIKEKTATNAKDFKLDFNNTSFTIHKRSRKNDLKFYTKKLKEMGIESIITDIERNKEGFITAIKIKLIDTEKNSEATATWDSSRNEKGIPDISLGRKKGKLIITSN
jgi:hypothetical protein